ncbi:MAG: DNA mismatch repair endonuclease MutL, partial [Muribaculum sp.]|nr:DNA mismatch repair endonuclease MutL [Muribaculum sp.]
STSKITMADDLYALHTMGFRGEALASISAVSEVELKTMRRDDSIGTRIVIAGSKVISQEPISCKPGSSMMVKRLFFNTPARRKFLKSDSVEMGHILREFERLALVNPGIEFELVHNDTLVHRLLKGTFKQRIVDLFGRSMDSQLVPISSETSIVKIEGFVGRPENARKRGALQYFMVNGRNMKHPYFHRAVTDCYEKLIANDAQPNYFINLTVDPQTIDVNIHPTKNEIKFENEQPIWQILMATIREALGKFNVAPAIDFSSTDTIDLPDFSPDPESDPSVKLASGYNPFSATSTPSKSVPSGWDKGVRIATSNWDKLYEDFVGKGRDDNHEITTAASALNDVSETLFETDVRTHTSLMQLKNRYILTSCSSGLMVIDQHRAHVAILYHRFISMAANDRLVSQRSIFPETLQLSASDNQTMEMLLPHLDRMGFEVERAGENAWSVNAMPAVLSTINPHDIIPEMLALSEETALMPGEKILDRVALEMARAGAIKIEQPLNDVEIDQIVSDLFSLPEPNYAPDGRKIINIISIDDLNRLFA